MGHEAVVIGAGPAGLACAAALKAIGGSVTLLERENEMAPAWRRHYDTYIRPRGILVCLVCRCHESIRIIRHEIR